MRLWLAALLLLSAQAKAAQPAPLQPQAEAPKADDIGPPPPPEDAPPPPPPLEIAPPVHSTPAPKQQMSPPDAWLPRATATLRVMNKIDSTVQSITIPVGGSSRYQSLAIQVSGCLVRPDDLPTDAAAHVTIRDTRPDQPGLDAWILKNEPALHMLEHPVYDVQLAGCA